jgi:hypothetical protein
MRYLTYLFGSFVIAAISYFALVFVLFPTPVAAEYWVRELLVFKREIGKQIGDQKKIIVASGSGTLFNIDTTSLTKSLGIPAINLGLMGGLPIDTILHEVNSISRKGDVVVMALEPDYYCREANPGYDSWQNRNAIAWNHEFWINKTLLQKIAALPSLGSKFPLEMINARLNSIFKPEIIAPRMAALDDNKILKKFSESPNSSAEPIFSIYNMDSLGNIKNINESNYSGPVQPAEEDIKICPQTLEKLTKFVSKLKDREITVFFANTPYIAYDEINLSKVDASAKRFSDAMKHLGPVIDKRAELVFPRDHFFDSILHLNQKGRERNTQILLNALQSLNLQKSN